MGLRPTANSFTKVTPPMPLIISGLDVFVLKASSDSRPHWVSHFFVPSANEVLVQVHTNEGVEGFGLATSYTDVSSMLAATLLILQARVLHPDDPGFPGRRCQAQTQSTGRQASPIALQFNGF
jgi:L-alanine-DL-glutamate epimerase-like enolase superfamily enzyme